MTEPKSFKSYDSGVEPHEDVVARAQKWLASFQKAVASRDHIGHRYSAVAARLVPELVAEVERLRTELTFARDGMELRPMTAVESNLMTQVLGLRRQLAAAGIPIEGQQ